jgi:hypothetical protein
LQKRKPSQRAETIAGNAYFTIAEDGEMVRWHGNRLTKQAQNPGVSLDMPLGLAEKRVDYTESF